jgi:PAS domain S-box-containing protein
MGVNFVVLAYLAQHVTQAAEKTPQALEQSEQTLRAILAAAPVGIALVKAREIFWANESLGRILGYPDGRIRDRDILRFYPRPEDLARLEHMAHEEGQAAIDIPAVELQRRDGSVFPGLIQIRPLAPGDRSQGSIVVVVDVSAQQAAAREREALQQRFQRAEKMEAVGAMAGGVAHDLNNLLSGFVSYPDVLLLDLAADHPLRKPLETIRHCGRKAAAIVQDLLTLTRRGVPVRESIDLNRAVTEYLESPEHDHLRRSHPLVRFEAALADESPSLTGSPLHLAKTLMNLAVNACEAMPRGGSVRIATERRHLERPHPGYELVPPGRYAVLSVADPGHGIQRPDLERIFEPFYTRKVMGRSGTGLGLAVVWGTVKDAGGFIDVVSAVDQGTRFDLYFPAAAAPSPVAAPALPGQALRGAGEHVLVVDDLEEQRRIAAGMLEALGYRVTALAGGEEALAWLASRKTDLLLLDMIMDPGMDGLETYRRILARRPGQKALIASGFSDTERVTQTLALGPARCLKKPYSLADLGLAVQALLAS